MFRKLALVSLIAGAAQAEESESVSSASSSVNAASEFTVPSISEFFYAETFQTGLTWLKTAHPDYAAQQVVVESDASAKQPFDKDQALVLVADAQKYGVAGKFESPLVAGGKPLVVQYEVKLTKGLSCGGAYLKLLREGVDVANFDNKSPFTIMFGPDSCGETNKVHFILQHQNGKTKKWEEKHATETPAPVKDTMTHLYTLVVRPDNSYEIFVDLESKSKGNLLEDMSPSVNPPAEIDDPTDSKPSDWEDNAKIKDPEAVKPDDWDESAPRRIPDPKAEMPSDWLVNEPLEVADPKATKPSDWDDEEDGDWEAPTVPNPACEKVSGCGEWKRPEIANPAYKGKWTAPLIDNPKYKGPWKARQIPNPDYDEDLEPAKNMAPMSAVAVEVWTMSGGIRIDNVVIGFDEKAALKFGQQTFAPKHKLEIDAAKKLSSAEKKAELERKREEGGLNNMIEVYVNDFMDLANEKPFHVLGSLLALMASLIFLCARGLRGSGDLTEEEIRAHERKRQGSHKAAEDAAKEEAEKEVAEEDKAAEAAAAAADKKED